MSLLLGASAAAQESELRVRHREYDIHIMPTPGRAGEIAGIAAMEVQGEGGPHENPPSLEGTKESLKAGGTDNSVRVLVVEDSEPWQSIVSTTLQKQPDLRIIGSTSDGLAAVRNAEELHPDLILLDIGIPSLNGIEMARRIREVSPTSKVLLVSQNRSRDIVEKALGKGTGGYVYKTHAGDELVRAIKVVLEGKRFISASLAGQVVSLWLRP